jgi:hypothetical protein
LVKYKIYALNSIEIWESLKAVDQSVNARKMFPDFQKILRVMKDKIFSFGVLVGLKSILLDKYGNIIKKKRK